MLAEHHAPQDWALTVIDEEPRVQDLVLAQKLGLERPRDIRKTIKRMIDDGRLNAEVLRRATVEHQTTGNGGQRAYQVDQFFLTEEEALLVTTQSKTPKAREILREVVRVFLAFRRGLLPAPKPDLAPSVPAVDLTALLAAQAETNRAVVQLANQISQLVLLQRQPAPASRPPAKPITQRQPELPLGNPDNETNPWYWPAEIARRLNISIREVWGFARQLGLAKHPYIQRARRYDGTIGEQFHRWAATEIYYAVRDRQKLNQ